MDEPVLECQSCGRILHYLTAEEARRVANKPDDFVFDVRRSSILAHRRPPRDRLANLEAPQHAGKPS
jgi:hypothetical protein